MSKGNDKKSHQLGEPHGTACNKMKKQLLFRLMKKCGMDICYQCRKSIDGPDEMSIEHKIPWLDSNDPVGLFYDPKNICFSHIHCNISARRNALPTVECPSQTRYRQGCRCKGCCKEMRRYHREDKRKKRNTPVSRFKI